MIHHNPRILDFNKILHQYERLLLMTRKEAINLKDWKSATLEEHVWEI